MERPRIPYQRQPNVGNVNVGELHDQLQLYTDGVIERMNALRTENERRFREDPESLSPALRNYMELQQNESKTEEQLRESYSAVLRENIKRHRSSR